MRTKTGATLVELLVVLAIIGGLLGILLPALQAARERARETVCRNNVNQINLALANLIEVYKKLPPPSLPGKVGGWAIEILPFIEQQPLYMRIKVGANVASLGDDLFKPPTIFRCPKSSDAESVETLQMTRGHYSLVTTGSRKHFSGVSDSPVSLNVPWVSGPEQDYAVIFRQKGPHHDGFFFSLGFQQGVGFMLNGEEVR